MDVIVKTNIFYSPSVPKVVAEPLFSLSLFSLESPSQKPLLADATGDKESIGAYSLGMYA
jgi:hypothetical protein